MKRSLGLRFPVSVYGTVNGMIIWLCVCFCKTEARFAEVKAKMVYMVDHFNPVALSCLHGDHFLHDV